MEYNALVMAPVSEEVWVVSRVQKVDGANCLIKTEKDEEVVVPVASLVPVNPQSIVSSDDMTKLEQLHESLILHNLRLRFHQGIVYTYIGQVIVSVNPFRNIPELGPHRIPEYLVKDREEVPPHLYSVAQRAYRSLVDFGNSQSIVIIGESGAGKTEATKIVLKFLTVASDKAPNSELDISTMIIATNPILEAFGNAKTTRNDNSSRFGKFIKIIFDGKKISGASIDNYLLEKTRVVKQAPTERNYHIFYQMINGMDKTEKEKYLILEKEEMYRYLTNGRVPLPNDDVKDWHETVNALRVLGFSQTDFENVFTLLSSILWLGNIEFYEVRDSSSMIKDDEPLRIFCQLLGLSQNLFGLAKTSFTSRSVRVVGRNSVTFVPLTKMQAEANRDALAKRLYNDLFNWLVQKLNVQLKQTKSPQNSLSNSSRDLLSIKTEEEKFIGVLDIYGFEIFQQNSLEQFCINYANEKLHQQFNHHMFKSEQEEYINEGVPWTKIDFKDNSGCIGLIEKQKGIIDFIQEQCKLRDCSDEGLIQQMKKNIKSLWFDHGHPSDPTDQFAIKHFAGTVNYSAVGFIDKNKDTLNTDMEMLMKKTSNVLVTEFFADEVLEEEEPLASARNSSVSPREPPSRRSFAQVPVFSQPKLRASGSVASKQFARDKKTVTVRFREDLTKLLETLSLSDRHYVRCIKPNDLRSDKVFSSEKVMSQLLCNGIFETVALRKAGFSIRMLIDLFIDKYWAILPSQSREGIESFLNSIMPGGHEWYMGKNKVFLRDSGLEMIATKLGYLWNGKCIILQSHIRTYNVVLDFSRTQSTRTIQAFIRRKKAILQLENLRTQNQAATTLQNYIRSKNAWNKYIILKVAYDTRMSAVLVIQKHLRRFHVQCVYFQLVKKHDNIISRERQYKDYYDCTTFGIGNNSDIQKWIMEVETNRDDGVIIVVVDK